MNSPEVQAKISAALEAAESGAASIASLKMQLDSYNSFYTGLQTYTAGVSAASAGASKLSSGASELYDGVCELTDGIFTTKKVLKRYSARQGRTLTVLHCATKQSSKPLKITKHSPEFPTTWMVR